MTQRINLYHAPEVTKIKGPTFKHLLWGIGCFLGVLCLVSVWDFKRYYEHSSELARLEKTKETLAMKIKTLPQQPTQDIYMAEVQRLQIEEIQKQGALNTFGKMGALEYKGFSSLLQALSNQAKQGLWLTKCFLKEGGAYIEISGKTIHPQLLTRWIDGLNEEKAFKHIDFQMLKVYVDKAENVLNFSVATKAQMPASKQEPPK